MRRPEPVEMIASRNLRPFKETSRIVDGKDVDSNRNS